MPANTFGLMMQFWQVKLSRKPPLTFSSYLLLDHWRMVENQPCAHGFNHLTEQCKSTSLLDMIQNGGPNFFSSKQQQCWLLNKAWFLLFFSVGRCRLRCVILLRISPFDMETALNVSHGLDIVCPFQGKKTPFPLENRYHFCQSQSLRRLAVEKNPERSF